MPDLSTVLPGSLLSRMVRCNKAGCCFCEKWQRVTTAQFGFSLSVWGIGRCQIPIPGEMKKEVEDSLRAFAQMQKLLKQIAGVNLELLKERKRQQ